MQVWGVPSMSVDTLADLSEAAKEGTWVRWLANAVWAAARGKVVVRVVLLCLQDDQIVCKCESTKRVVSAFRR